MEEKGKNDKDVDIAIFLPWDKAWEEHGSVVDKRKTKTKEYYKVFFSLYKIRRIVYKLLEVKFNQTKVHPKIC